ncbi:MAG: histidine triad nucleotide-binding protein [Gemmatimonadota bacterium]
MTDSGCIFCRIASGEIDSDRVYDGERVVAFRDLDPKAPTHILVIPRAHVPSVADLEDGDAPVIGELLLAARDIAREEGLVESGYRLVLNSGAGAGQSVFHLHLHLLGGRQFGWPPG